MFTLSSVLYHRPNKEGKHQLAIRITKDRKSSYVFLGQYIDKSQWNKKAKKVKRNHPNSTRLNALLTKKMAEINTKLLTGDLEDKVSTAQDAHKDVLKKPEKNSFFTVADQYNEALKGEGKYNQYNTNVPRIKRFKEFLKGKDIRFQDITVSLLRKFKAHLIKIHKVSERTAINYLILIRTIYNRAIGDGLVDRKHYPFGKNKIVIKFPDSEKLGLSRDEVTKLEEVDLSNHPKMHHARNLWLFSFYFAGMRISDVLLLTWSDFNNGRLHYQMGKNDKRGSLKIPDKAQAILEQYKSEEGDNNNLIFPDLETVDDFTNKYLVQRKTSYAVKNNNKWLKQLGITLDIKQKLTMHLARHTFGALSGDRIPIQMLQKLYRHSDITTTINYQKAFIYKDADDALDAVLNS